MPKSKLQLETQRLTPRAFMVGVHLTGDAYKQQHARLALDASMQELALLCETAGLEVVGETRQTLEGPNPNTYIGSGKVEELSAWQTALDFSVVVFDDELSPRHQRELEEALGEGILVLDRTAVILDIFAQHAQTREGALQVELAQYQYRLPRLTRQWTHLARQAGGGSGRSGNGGVGLRGPGEKQLEIDRRRIRERLSRLKDELDEVRAQRAQHRAQRRRNEVPVVAIVGYTNAGKSTLLNTLTNSNVLVENKLFATLDPTTRRVHLPGGHNVLFTDTVGFIQKLPTQLVAAFRATLEEITEADALLHVVDIMHPDHVAQAQTVLDTLTELGAGSKPMIIALNKADRLPKAEISGIEQPMPWSAAPGLLSEGVPISALRKTGMDALLKEIEVVLYEQMVPIRVRLPYKAGDLMALFRREGTVDSEVPEERSILLTGRIPSRLRDTFLPYEAKTAVKSEEVHP